MVSGVPIISFIRYVFEVKNKGLVNIFARGMMSPLFCLSGKWLQTLFKRVHVEKVMFTVTYENVRALSCQSSNLTVICFSLTSTLQCCTGSFHLCFLNYYCQIWHGSLSWIYPRSVFFFPPQCRHDSTLHYKRHKGWMLACCSLFCPFGWARGQSKTLIWFIYILWSFSNEISHS